MKTVTTLLVRIVLVGLLVLGVSFTTVTPAYALGTPTKTQESVSAQANTFGPSYRYRDGLVTDFDSSITLDKKGNAKIVEVITVYFPSSKHGIYRWIPNEVTLDTGKTLKQPIKITSLSYRELPHTNGTYTDGGIKAKSYTSTKTSGNYTKLQIGDADTLISGAYEYTIEYTMTRAVRFQHSYQELYLNITGDQWEIPILASSATVYPANNIEETKCFTGPSKSAESNCSITPSSSSVTFKTTAPATELAEGLTIALKYKDGTFAPPTALELLLEMILPLTPLLLPIFVFFYARRIFKMYGEDKPVSAIPPLYVPTKEMEIESLSIQRSLLGMKAEEAAILAEIIRLAEKGYLTISYADKKVSLLISETQKTKLEEYLATQPSYLLKLISTLTKSFSPETQLNKLKDVYDDIAKVNSQVGEAFKASPYITNVSESKQSTFVILGTLCLVGGGALFFILLNANFYDWVMLPLAVAISGIILLAFSAGMLKRTPVGDQMYLDLLGMKKYIKAAEVKRLEFFNDPEKMISHFEQILPYAVILKLDKQWTTMFGPILEQLKYEPSWMVSNQPLYTVWPHTYASFSSSVASNVTKLSTPPQSSSSSFGGGGGGFSGGGSGGGGGGSW